MKAADRLRSRRAILCAAAVAALGTTLFAWQAQSSHQVRFISVEPNVELEVLDWGGAGRAVIPLAGSGLPPPPPACEPEDRRSFAAYRRTSACGFGFTFPEEELRSLFDEEADGSVGPAKSPGWVSHAIGQRQVFRRDYSGIRVPVLALNNGFGPDSTTDVLKTLDYVVKSPDDRAAIDRLVARSNVLVGRWIDKLSAARRACVRSAFQPPVISFA